MNSRIILALILALGPQADSELGSLLKADDARSIGRQEMWNGDYKKAVAQFERALEADPGLAICRTERAYALHHQGQLERAVEAFREAAGTSPRSYEPRIGLAMTLATAGEWEAAMAAHRDAIRVDLSWHAGTNASWTCAGLASSSVQESFAMWDEAVRANPENALALFLRGALFEGDGQADAAARDWRAAVAADDEFALPYVTLALQADVEASRKIELISKAIDLGLTQATIYNERGLTHASMDDWKAARADFQAATEDGWHARAHVHLAVMLHVLGKGEEALGVLSKLGRHDAVATSATGLPWWEPQTALQVWQAAAQQNVDDASAWLFLGNSQVATGQAREAVASYGRALAAAPDFAVGAYQLGYAHVETGESARALKAFDQALKLDPELWPAANAAGLTAANLRNHEAAVAHFTKGIQIEPEAAICFYRRGLALTWLDEWDAASLDLSRAARLSGDEAAEAYFQRALIRGREDADGSFRDLTLSLFLQATAKAFLERSKLFRQAENMEACAADLAAALGSSPTEEERRLALGGLGELGRLKPCLQCHGAGNMSCTVCLGSGKRKCYSCHSTGHKNGSYSEPPNSCWSCYGNLRCNSCFGTTRSPCLGCGGLGQTVR